MALEDLLSDLMVETITLAPASSRDGYGKRSFGSAVTISNCRVEGGAHKVTDENGQEIVASGLVYVPGSPVATPESFLTLPDGSTPRILVVDRLGDERGSHHTVIHYGL